VTLPIKDRASPYDPLNLRTSERATAAAVKDLCIDLALRLQEGRPGDGILCDDRIGRPRWTGRRTFTRFSKRRLCAALGISG